jgi:dihydroneopterin aldolase
LSRQYYLAGSIVFMLTIHLENLKFHAYHGLYAEEQVLGGDFEVNITLQHHPQQLHVTQLHQTINYVSVYHLVKQRMQQPEPLLETLAYDICQSILQQFQHAQVVHISIYKLQPPITQFQGRVGVSLQLSR